MEFYVNTFGNLVVKEGRQIETLLTCKFMQRDNQVAATAWLRTLATQLNGMEAESQEMAEVLQAAEAKLNAAQLDEKCLKPITF